MPSKFATKKQEILNRLSLPNKDYSDASPKGSVDEKIRKFVEEINATPGFITTSSCSGRLAIFLEGPLRLSLANVAKLDDETGKEPDATRTTNVRSGTKGGGHWLFTTHEPLELKHCSDQGAVFERLGFAPDAKMLFPRPMERPQFVHFKFEPMILHILTESVEEAELALKAALTAGFRESGISGLSASKHQPTSPMVAVRSAGLSFDCIVGFQSETSGGHRPCPMVSESYLRTLVTLCNERFEVNAQRMERFRQAFLEGVSPPQVFVSSARSKDDTFYEPADARRDRMRKEGLLRKQALRQLAAASTQAADGENGKGDDSIDKEFGLDLLNSDDG